MYLDALRRIDELNRNRRSGDAMFGQTKFSDRRFSEFVQQRTGGLRESQPAPKFDLDLTSMIAGVPSKFDWRDEGRVVPTIRDQHECGACYAFATTDLTAIQWAVDRGEEEKSYALAPQYVLDCIRGEAGRGCDGGRPFLVLESNTNCTNGLDQGCVWPSESCLPYKNQADEKCPEPGLKCVEEEKPQIKVQRAYYLDLSSSTGSVETSRLSALLQGGPVVALVTVTDHWLYYISGTMRATQCLDNAAGDPNHAVVIVGYDFTDPSNPYYIIRNSWNEDWGERGYFRLEAGANACGVGQFLSFACTTDCGDGRDAKQLVERARRRLQARGIQQPGPTTTPPPPPYQPGSTVGYIGGGYTPLITPPVPRPYDNRQSPPPSAAQYNTAVRRYDNQRWRPRAG